MLVVQHEVLQAFFLQSSLGFLLRATLFLVTLCLSETRRQCCKYFESSDQGTELSTCSAWAACHCLVLHVYLMWFGVGSCISLFLFLCLLMVETKGGRYVSVTGGCSCQDYSLTCYVFVLLFFSLLLFCLKLEIILWMQGSTGISPEKWLQIWLRTELLKSAGGGFLCVTLNYHFFPIS